MLIPVQQQKAILNSGSGTQKRRIIVEFFLSLALTHTFSILITGKGVTPLHASLYSA